MPNGAPEIPFAPNDRADAIRKFTVSVADMWPYLARSHWMMASGVLETHAAPGAGEGLGDGDGDGAGAAGVRNTCVALHALAVSLSAARTRQYIVALLA